MARSQRPHPTALVKLHGNPSRLRLDNDEPQGVDLIGLPPDWFDDEQREQWAAVMERAPLGLLSETDRDVVTAFCVACVEYRRAVLDVRKRGHITKANTNGYSYPNPSLGIMNKQLKAMLDTGDRIGFSPSARAALGRAGQVSNGPPGQIAGSRLARYLDAKPDKLE